MPAVNISAYRRRIAGLIIRGFPEYFSRGFVESNNARARFAARDNVNRAIIHEWRAGYPEKPFGCVELLRQINLPNPFTVRHIETRQDSLCAIRKYFAIGNRWRGARPFIESKIIAIG